MKRLPTLKVPSTVPSLGRNLVTVPPSLSATQILVPSNATAVGFAPMAKSPSFLPSLARSLMTVPIPSLFIATHTLAPSNAIPRGSGPTPKIPSTVPSSLARSLVTLPPKDGPLFTATQILAPLVSEATPGTLEKYLGKPRTQERCTSRYCFEISSLAQRSDESMQSCGVITLRPRPDAVLRLAENRHCRKAFSKEPLST